MFRCLKTALAQTIPFCRRLGPEDAPAAEDLSTLEISDRLHNVICELAVIDMAVAGGIGRGFDLERYDANGLLLMLSRQMTELAILRDAVYRPRQR